jgi:hypothetical protein
MILTHVMSNFRINATLPHVIIDGRSSADSGQAEPVVPES